MYQVKSLYIQKVQFFWDSRKIVWDCKNHKLFSAWRAKTVLSLWVCSFIASTLDENTWGFDDLHTFVTKCYCRNLRTFFCKFFRLKSRVAGDGVALFDISISNIDCRYFCKNSNIDMVIFENIDIDRNPSGQPDRFSQVFLTFPELQGVFLLLPHQKVKVWKT